MPAHILQQVDKKICDHFNQPDTKIVVSRWPGKKTGTTYDGVATYTQDITEAFAKEFKQKFIVLAEKISGEDEVFFEIEDRILILRIFDPYKKSVFPQILKALNHFKNVKSVYVHSEFCASGGPELRILTVPFLLLIKLMNRHVTYYAHNVVRNLDKLASHFNIPRYSLKFQIMQLGLKLHYATLWRAADKFVVLEEDIKNRLSQYVPKNRITVQPHWIRLQKNTISKKKARRKLGLPLNKKVIMSFGFVTYYKGADWYVQFAERVSEKSEFSDYHFVLAGGQAASLKNQKYYQNYYNQIKTKSEELSNLYLSGFIAENEIKYWFAAADLVILPYRTLIGGSGAMQKALMYEKPIIMTKRMYQPLTRGLTGLLLKRLDIEQDEVAFAINSQSLENLLLKLEDPIEFARLEQFSHELSETFSYKQMVMEHYAQVYQTT